MNILIIVLLVLLCVGGLPNVGYIPHSFGYAPSGLGFILVIVLLVLLLGGRF